MSKLFRYVNCEHCTGRIDLFVQDFAWNKEGDADHYFHVECWFEKYGKEAEGENSPDNPFSVPN